MFSLYFVSNFDLGMYLLLSGSVYSLSLKLSPGSTCGLVAYTLRILAQWYFLWDIKLFLTGSGLMT